MYFSVSANHQAIKRLSGRFFVVSIKQPIKMDVFDPSNLKCKLYRYGHG